MPRKRLTTTTFVLEGINSFATAYYFNYLFFLLRDEFGFGSRENLLISALHGFVYVGAAWYGGQFAQRRGYLTALRFGFGGMAIALALGAVLPSVIGQIVAIVLWTIPMCFTWPALEALVCDGEPRSRVPRMIGIYNVVWAGSAALGYFTGGALFDQLGRKSVYWLPIAMHAAQLVLTAWLARGGGVTHGAAGHIEPHVVEATALRQPISPRTFLKLAWFANPFAYIAINTVLPVIPKIAERMDFSPTQAGVFCSVWFFVRLAAFVVLWQWTGWHYRFRWMVLAYAGLIGSFATLLLAERLWLLVGAQLVFGLSTGLIYYSSLFYSMDVGETKGEHGGIHEAAIGLGIFVGPAVGATSLTLFPQIRNAATWAVSALLAVGFVTLLALRWRRVR